MAEGGRFEEIVDVDIVFFMIITAIFLLRLLSPSILVVLIILYIAFRPLIRKYVQLLFTR